MNMRKKKKQLKKIKRFLTSIRQLHADGSLVYPNIEDVRQCGKTGVLSYILCKQYKYVKLIKETTPKWRRNI